jgi:hypothetical protein
MDFFGFLFGYYDDYGYGRGRNHWYSSNEKSRQSQGREDEAKKKFDAMRRTMEVSSFAALSFFRPYSSPLFSRFVDIEGDDGRGYN